MPTFKQIAAPVAVAGLIAGALTTVLSAQTGPTSIAPAQMTATQITPAQIAPAQIANAAPVQDAGVPLTIAVSPAAPGVSRADELFANGLTAYRGGDLHGAVSIWEEAADIGHIGAQWNLARLFASDDSAVHDARRRRQYLEMIARQHDPDMPPGPRSAITVEALVELGQLYLTGDSEAGIAPEASRAFRMFQHSATLFGHPRAQHLLGLMYLRGQAVTRDVSQAMRWLFLAARKQYAPSQAALGDIFWEHAADNDDRLEGLMWMGLASRNANGEEFATAFADRYEAAIDEVGEDMRPRVNELISAWTQSNGAGTAQ